MGERRWMEARSRLLQPTQEIRTELNSLFAMQHQSFPSTDRRYPKFIQLVSQLWTRTGAEALGALQEPDPDVSI